MCDKTNSHPLAIIVKVQTIAFPEEGITWHKIVPFFVRFCSLEIKDKIFFF